MATQGAVGSLERLWRYPVKSMRGELLASAAVDERGLVGDRLFAVWDAEGKFGSCKNTTRFRRMDGLLDFASRYPEDPRKQDDCRAELTAPDGTRHPVPSPAADAAVRAHLERDDVSVRIEGEICQLDASPLHLVSTATLDWFTDGLAGVPADERRLRPNLLVRVPGAEAFVEDGWVGRRIRIGEVLLAVTAQTMRCRTLNVEQDDLPYTSRALKLLAARDLMLGVKVSVVQPGRIQAGDPVAFED